MANVYRNYFNSLVGKLRTTYLERRAEDREKERRLMTGKSFKKFEMKI